MGKLSLSAVLLHIVTVSSLVKIVFAESSEGVITWYHDITVGSMVGALGCVYSEVALHRQY